MSLPDDVDPFVALFSESAGRVLVSLPEAHRDAFVALCETHRIPVRQLGVVGGDQLLVDDQFAVGLDELRAAWSGTIPAAVAA